jgi:hypothetical protein
VLPASGVFAVYVPATAIHATLEGVFITLRGRGFVYTIGFFFTFGTFIFCGFAFVGHVDNVPERG